MHELRKQLRGRRAWAQFMVNLSSRAIARHVALERKYGSHEVDRALESVMRADRQYYRNQLDTSVRVRRTLHALRRGL